MYYLMLEITTKIRLFMLKTNLHGKDMMSIQEKRDANQSIKHNFGWRSKMNEKLAYHITSQNYSLKPVWKIEKTVLMNAPFKF